MSRKRSWSTRGVSCTELCTEKVDRARTSPNTLGRNLFKNQVSPSFQIFCCHRQQQITLCSQFRVFMSPLVGAARLMSSSSLLYGWEMFIVTDMRHRLWLNTIGAPQSIGYTASGGMRRSSRKPQKIDRCFLNAYVQLSNECKSNGT